MTANVAITSQQIKQAAAALKKLRPAYREIIDFYDKMSFKANIFQMESCIEPNKYNLFKMLTRPRFLLKFIDFIVIKEGLTPFNATDIVNRFGKFMLSNKITRNFDETTVSPLGKPLP